MAAAGPRGRDGPSPREFTAVRHFMMADLGLSGLPLLVYARIFGFCDGGSSGVQRNAIVLLRLRALFSHGILLTPSLRRARRPSRPASWGTGARSGR